MCSIRHQKPLQNLGRHGFERHTRRYRIMLPNNGYQNNLYSIAQQIDSIKRRSNYLRANMWYYVKDLPFEGQYLPWCIYVWPYFLHIASIIETQAKTLQKSFHGLYLKSFKQFMGLPSNLPSETLECIFYYKNQTCAIANTKTRRKVSTTFGVQIDEGLQY
jgi:hypothetical protein